MAGGPRPKLLRGRPRAAFRASGPPCGSRCEKKGPAPTSVPGGVPLPCFGATASQQGSWTDATCFGVFPRGPWGQRDGLASFPNESLAVWESGSEHGRRGDGGGSREVTSSLRKEEERNGFHTWARKTAGGVERRAGRQQTMKIIQPQKIHLPGWRVVSFGWRANFLGSELGAPSPPRPL